MEGGESPLDVLSRAATMVQETQQALINSEDPSKQSNKQLPTAKWKRDRRCRLPEYTRKSDPKITETFGDSLTNSSITTTTAIETTTTTTTTTNNQESSNGPLDMSVRQRGLPPPSYNQTINNPSYRCGGNIRSRPSVIQNNREELPPGISMCDPIIDEHFRRSLGNDYLTLFSNNNVTKETIPIKQTPSPPPPPPPPPPPSSKKIPTTNVIELMDTAGLSVDDHFAKALGDTWLKLNKKEQEIKNNNNNNNNENLVSI